MQRIETGAAAAAIGPYSQAVRTGQMLFVSGQIPLDPESGNLVSDSIESQTHRVLQNVQAILHAAGASFESVARATIYLTDLDDFATVNAIYATYVGDPPPARSTVQVAALPRSSRIEIDVIAIIPGSQQPSSTDLA